MTDALANKLFVIFRFLLNNLIHLTNETNDQHHDDDSTKNESTNTIPTTPISVSIVSCISDLIWPDLSQSIINYFLKPNVPDTLNGLKRFDKEICPKILEFENFGATSGSDSHSFIYSCILINSITKKPNIVLF